MWFEGSVADCVAVVQGVGGTLLTVYEDGSDASNALVALLESKPLRSLLTGALSGRVVCLRVADGTEDGSNLKAAFPAAPVPGVLCFDTAEQRVVFTANAATATQENLLSALSALTQNPNEGGKADAGSQQEKKPERASSSSSPQSLPMEDTRASANISKPKTPLERKEEIAQKLKRVEEKMTAAKTKRLEKERNEHKQQEIERRKAMKAMQSAQTSFEEKERVKLAQERRKERLDKQKRLQAIRQKVEEDKARRRNAAQQGHHSDKDQNLSSPTNHDDSNPRRSNLPSSSSSSTRSNPPSSATHSSCKISLRLPQGGSEIIELPAATTIAELYRHVRALLSSETHEIILKTPYPVATLDASSETSLLSMGFCPRVALTVHLRELAPKQPGPCESLMALVYSFFGSVSGATMDKETTSDSSTSSTTQSEGPSQRQPRAGQRVRRRVGRISDFSSKDSSSAVGSNADDGDRRDGDGDGDDTNDAYNGNSTQFHM